MSLPTNEFTRALLVEAGHALSASQGNLGSMLGVSRRTINRWTRDGPSPSPRQVSILARAVHAVSPALAEKIAATSGETLVSLGLVQPAPRIESPRLPPHQVDLVVCAAAEALDASPRVVRPALLAAFQRAREAGMTVEAVEDALRGVGKTGTKRR